MKLLSIAFVGVDGVGKSSIVKRVEELFPHDMCVLQYMGLKEWETWAAKQCMPKQIATWKKQFRSTVLLYELWHRVYKYRREKRIVIFDRYVDEQYLQYLYMKDGPRTKIKRFVYKWFFIDHFYRPTITFYLTCDIATSLSRKDDITSEKDVERLKSNKTMLDNYYKNENRAVVIDTSDKSIEDTMNLISSELRKIECFNIMMN